MREPDLFISSGTFDRPITDALNSLFIEAANRSAADIHLQEADGRIRVRYRVRGVLEDVRYFEKDWARLIDEKIRSRANISASERNNPVDGRLRLRYDDRQIDVRVSIVPSILGQTTVCRLLDQSNAGRSLDDIELSEPARQAIHEIIEQPSGLVVVTGPTGSGKTTLLYALVNALNNPGINIVTIENPVEYTVPGLTQINVGKNMTFADALRAVLRQDPDVVLVGEIRDAETAQIAVQASITGHLVLTTLHSNNAALAISRLVDLGVDPATLAAALRCVTAQRLIRRITGEPVYADPTEVQRSWLSLHGIIPRGQFASCEQRDGVVPIVEMIVADDAVRRAMSHGPTAIFNAAANQAQFETLAQSGVRMARAGIAALDDVRRAVGSGDVTIPHVKRVGQVLVELGVVDHWQLHDAMVMQAKMRREGLDRPLGEVLITMGACTMEDVTVALGHSADAIHAASYFVKIGNCSDDQMQEVVAEWQGRRKGESLFDLLLNRGYCTREELMDPRLIHS